MTGRSAPLLLLAAGFGLALGACGDDDTTDDPTVETTGSTLPANDDVAIVTAAIRQVSSRGVPADDPDRTPVVYVVSVAEGGISAGIQADVVSQLRDEVDVRFADAREEAIEESDPTAPVPDDGVLLVIGDIAEVGRPVVVAVEIYRNVDDWTKSLFTVAPEGVTGDDAWDVTSTSEVPLDAP
jgi:hypothetical protein